MSNLDGRKVHLQTWQNPQTYEWTKVLPRRACAWEFLRRNPSYRAAWELLAASRIAGASSDFIETKLPNPDGVARAWGLLWPLEDPNCDAREAKVFWSPTVCSGVLSVVALSHDEIGQAELLPFSLYHCRKTVCVDADDTQHVLFSEAGRSLQMVVRGAPIASAIRLLADVPRPGHGVAARLRAIKQLADLQIHRELRPHLYPAHGQSRRLIEILQALDGALQGESHREVAVALYGAKRVAEDWAGQNRQMRDKVRKTIARGMELMEGGYRQFLK